MGKKQTTLPLVQRVTDVIVTVAAWELSFYIRFHLFSDGSSGRVRDFFIYSLIVAVLVLFFSTQNGLYENHRYFPWYREFLLVIHSRFQAAATFVIALYFLSPGRLSRITILLYIGIGTVFALIMRGILRDILKQSRLRGRNTRKILLVGKGTALNSYIEILQNSPERGIRFIGWIASNGEAGKMGIRELNPDEISLDGEESPDAVFIGYDAENHDQLEKNLEIFNQTFIQTLIIPDVENAFIGYTIDEFHGIPMISINAPSLTMLHAGIKRAIDITGALIGLILGAPIFIILGLLIKLTSRGPVFYGQERMTRDGELFTMWKFRSMIVNAEKNGAQWTTKDDDRCTPLGKLMRKTSLDEIPQFWNVLMGNMSLVGPRPEQPKFVDQFKDKIPSYMLRHRMKTGLTGWAQVNGWRGDTSLEKRLEFDLYYIRNWSLFLDVKILFLTLMKGFIHENAY